MSPRQAVWLVAGGPMQVSLARAIKGLGYDLILTDFDSTCDCISYADVFVEKDTFDVAGNLEEARRLRSLFNIRACLTVAADCHPTVASLCEFLELPGISPAISKLCRNKLLTRETLGRAGIPQPKCMSAASLNEARVALATLGRAGVIKATDNSASRGFAYLPSSDSLTPDVYHEAVSAGTTGLVLIEQALIPRKDCIAEQSVETLWCNGKMYWLNWVDRVFRDELRFFPEVNFRGYENTNWAVEIGHLNPAIHPFSLKSAVYDMIDRAGRCLGMHRQKGAHILKADIMLTEEGPMIIELTPRLSGGWDSSGTTPARGGNFQVGALKLAMGESLTLDLWMEYFELRDPGLHSSILTYIPPGTKNCVGRKFFLGSGYDRITSLQSALSNLKGSLYVV